MKYGFAIVVVCMLALASCSHKVTKPVAPQKTAKTSADPSALVEKPDMVATRGAIPPGTPTIKVALLLPLSGDSAGLGKSMLDAATMALYDSYVAMPSDQIHSQIILMPKDSGNSASEAVRATKEAISQGATFIVGPLFSQSVTAIAPLAREKKIPILTFSNNKTVGGNGVYLFGFLPEQQVKRMADYAYLHGLQRVALLAPNDSYGQKIHSTLSEAYIKKGGMVSPTEMYAPSPANIDAAAARMATTYNNMPDERRFQAIFIADGGNQLKNIIASLKKTNIDLTKVKLLGTGLWDDPQIASIPELQNAWFSSSPPENYRSFERRFMSEYDYKPVRLVGLAYDVMTLLTTITVSSSKTEIDTAALLDPKGYISPANGLFRLKPDGTSDRRLAVMEVTAGGFNVIDPARKAFEDELSSASGSAQP